MFWLIIIDYFLLVIILFIFIFFCDESKKTEQIEEGFKTETTSKRWRSSAPTLLSYFCRELHLTVSAEPKM